MNNSDNDQNKDLENNTENIIESNTDKNQSTSQLLIKDFSNLNVMLLDDNKLFRKFLYKLLEINYNIKSLEMENPKEALEYMKTGLPNLILLDMEMPFMDGYTFLKLLRKSNTTKDLAVLPITAISSKELIINLSKYKIEDFIVKTTTPDVMLEKLTKVFNKISS